MRTIQRYILREFLIPLFYCLTGFLSVYVLFELFGSFSHLLDSGMSFGEIVLYFGGFLAPYFHYLAPAALLLATLYTMWSMCRHSEIIAMRASGVSFIAIVRPLLLIAFLLSLVVLYVNEVFVPAHAAESSRLKTSHFAKEKYARADNVVYRNAAASRTWNVDRLLRPDARSLGNVRLTMDRPNGERVMTVTASRADFLDGEWWFTDAHVQHFGESGREIASPTPALDALSFRSFGFLNERPADFLLQNQPWRYDSVAGKRRYLKIHPELTAAKRQECKYDIWAQAMAPWACIVITLFAIPAGIASGRQSVMKGVLGALGLYFAFYGVTIGCLVLAKNGMCPAPIAAIFPDALFLALGVRLFVKNR